MSVSNFLVLPKSVSNDPSETYLLSPEQIQFFEENGYLVIKKLFDLPTLESYRQRFLDVCNGKVSTNLLTVIKNFTLMKNNSNPESYIYKIQDILDDEVYMTYSENPRLLHIISQLIGEELTATNCTLINKPPGSEVHLPHQDLIYVPIRPAHLILGCWTAIDFVTKENGCLFVVPGPHKSQELLPHEQQPNNPLKFMFNLENWETIAPEHRRVYLEMVPGDTVLISSTLIHGSAPNVSKDCSKAITAHYANSKCHYIEVSGTVQEPVARSVQYEAIKKNVFHPITLADVLKFKSKTVKGVKCNL